MSEVVVCVDFGSTFTKAAVVERGSGALLAGGSHRTTIETDVLDGLDALLAQFAAQLPEADLSDVVACSSAGGGLRLAVVGYERAVTAEAGHRVGLSAGARVAHVFAGQLDDDDVAALRTDQPDVVLLVGGTDGGNTEVLVGNARVLAGARLGVPVVVAGNVAVQDTVVRALRRARQVVLPTANVLPRIGQLDPRPAREAIREVFIRHVIGGKHLSQRADLTDFVRAATPDAVLAGVELLADGGGDVPGAGDVVVVDVGGATTDVYSVLTPDPEESDLHHEVVEVMWRSRTVEGDLGVRWNAVGIVAAAAAERLITADEQGTLQAAAEERLADPGLVPLDPLERRVDARLATLAVTVALRRHARPQEAAGVRQPGKDLRRVRLVVGSGGVFRHGDPEAVATMLEPAVSDLAGGYPLPDRATTTLDADYVLAAAGLLVADDPFTAARLVSRLR